MAGFRAIVYDFLEVTFDQAMKFCESNDAGMFIPGSVELMKWLKQNAEESVWTNDQNEKLCITIDPSSGQSEAVDCKTETAGFICVKETTLNSQNLNALIKKYTGNITAAAKNWSPEIWKGIKEALAQKD